LDLNDPKQIAEAEQRELDIREKELNDIRAMLSTKAGLRFIWRLLESCNTFNTIFEYESNKMAYNSGKQDIGHFIMAEIVEADEGLLFKMMKMNKETR